MQLTTVIDFIVYIHSNSGVGRATVIISLKIGGSGPVAPHSYPTELNN